MASPNRQYESMLTVARERLSRHAPESIARRAGVTWDGGRLTLPSLGQTVTVTVPGFTVSPELDMWHALTLLHYLDLADGTPLLGKMMAFAQYPDGMVGDEEFPASGRLFLDESAAHYLTVEDAVTVGGLLLERLAGGPLLG